MVANENNKRYLETKKTKLGHIFDGTNLKDD
jgi:GTP cyclohydrolase II